LGYLLQAVVIFPLVAAYLFVEYSFFTLSPDATVKAYRQASERRQRAFVQEICHDVSCMYDVDWACGFEAPVGDERVVSCFLDEVAVAEPEALLRDLVKHCGSKYMEYTGFGTREDCVQHGGRWGVPVTSYGGKLR
jgi:hypothetical protein